MHRPGRSTHRPMMLGLIGALGVLAGIGPVWPGQAALLGFLTMTFLSSWIFSRGTLEEITAERDHRDRVFEDDRVRVGLRMRMRSGYPAMLVVVEDMFMASLNIERRQLLPVMSPRWVAHVTYSKHAERHRGFYMLGPVRFWAADPMGLHARRAIANTLTPLTVYPRALPLPGYRLPGPHAPSGPTLENRARTGSGEEIIGVRPYRPGDPLSRIHWRTSIRRRQLHTIEQDTPIRSVIAVFMDLTRPSRYGTGVESTSEMAISAGVSVMTEATALRHSISAVLVHEEAEAFPPGSGTGHLYLILDRLAVVSPGGELPFWESAGATASLLPPGSRAVFISPAATTACAESVRLVRLLRLRGVAVDVILIDERRFVRIWRDQDPASKDAVADFGRLTRALETAGARVLPLGRGDDAAALLPAAAAEIIT